MHRVQSTVPPEWQRTTWGLHVSGRGECLAYDGASGAPWLDDVGRAVVAWLMDNPSSAGSDPVPDGLMDVLSGKFSESKYESGER